MADSDPAPLLDEPLVPVAVEGNGEFRLRKVPKRPDRINGLSGGLDSPPDCGC
jgi:hypothetical protein